MATKPQLRFPNLTIFGGQMPEDFDRHLYGIEVKCFDLIVKNSSRRDARDVVGNVGGIRVLLENEDTIEILPDPSWEDTTPPQGATKRNFRQPLLMRARGDDKQNRGSLILRGGVSNETKGSVILLPYADPKSKSFEVLLAPILNEKNKWPKQKTPSGSKVYLPFMRLVAGSIPIWISSISSVGKALGISKDSDFVLDILRADLTGKPVLSDAEEAKGLNAWLTPEGIEFEAFLPGLVDKDGPKARFRLVWNPNEEERKTIPYLLQLIDVAEATIDSTNEEERILQLANSRKQSQAEIDAYEIALSERFQSLRQSSSPLVIDYNLNPTVPPLSWLVEFIDSNKTNVRLVGSRKAGVPSEWSDWTARLSPDVVRMRLLTRLTSRSELSVAELLVNRFEVSLVNGAFQIGLNVPARGQQIQPATGMKIDAGWMRARSDVAWKVSKVALPTAGQKVSIPIGPLKKRLLNIYREGGGIAPEATEPGFVFAPVATGWLQIPFLSKDRVVDRPEVQKTRSGINGLCHLELDGAKGSNAQSDRRVSVFDAALMSAIVKWSQPGSISFANSIEVSVVDARGQVTGLFFAAETSPNPTEILPTLSAGPAATRSLAISFGEEPGVRDWTGTFKAGANGDHELSLDVTPDIPFRSWLPLSRKMPLAASAPLTRVVASALLPSQSRGLAPAKCAAKVTLKWASFSDQVPGLVTEGWNWDSECMSKVPAANPPKGTLPDDDFSAIGFVSPVLPGVMMRPSDSKVTSALVAALRFDLPILDELFGQARLPRKGQNASQSELRAPTALNPTELGSYWRKSLEQVKLTATDEAFATPWIAVGSPLQTVSIIGLVQPYAWQPWVRFDHLAEGISLPVGGMLLTPIASAGPSQPMLTPAQALRGHSSPVNVVPRGNGVGAPSKSIDVIGFAAALYDYESLLWDSRGYGQATQPARVGTSAILRKARTIADKSRSLNPDLIDQTYTEVTLAKPLEFGISVKGEETKARFWMTREQAEAHPSVKGEETKARFWFAKLPCVQTGNSLVFSGENSPYERGGAYSGEAFEPKNLPKCDYEWRMFPEGENQYEFRVGPFGFRPLTLEEVNLTDQGEVKSFAVVGSLKAASPAPPEGELGQDDPFAHDNLVLLKVDLAANTSSIEKLEKSSVQFDLDVTVSTENSTSFGWAADDENLTPARLSLEVVGNGPLTTCRFAATLRCRLFGRIWELKPGALTSLDSQGFTIRFTPEIPSDGFDVGVMTLEVKNVSGRWESNLRVPLRLNLPVNLYNRTGSTPSPALAFRWENGEASWLGLKLSGTKVDIDHVSGRVRIPISLNDVSGELFEGFQVHKMKVHGLVEMVPFPIDCTEISWPKTGEPAGLWMEIYGDATEGQTHIQHLLASHALPDPRKLPQTPTPLAKPSEGNNSILLVTRTFEGESTISWPLSKSLKSVTRMAEGDNGRVSVVEFDLDENPFKDRVEVRISNHALPIAQLKQGENAVVLVGSWRCLATVRHTLSSTEITGKKVELKWTAAEYVTLTSDKTLVTDAKNLLDQRASGRNENVNNPLAFTPRFRKNHYRTIASAEQMRHPGLAVSALSAAGFTDPHLLKMVAGSKASGDLVILGGAPTLFQWSAANKTFATTTAFVLIQHPKSPDGDTVFPLRNLAQNVSGYWRVNEFDLNTMSLETDRSLAAGLVYGASEGLVLKAAISAMSAKNADLALRAVPVQQAFFGPCDRSGKPEEIKKPADQVPYFIGTLMILREALALWKQSPPNVQTVVAAQLHGFASRISVVDLKKAAPTSLAEATVPVRMLVLGHDGQLSMSSELAVGGVDPLRSVSGDAEANPGRNLTPTSYFLGTARLLAQDPRGALLTSVDGSGRFPETIDLPRPLNDFGLDALLADASNEPVFRGVSPALGWPTSSGISEAAALLIGFDQGNAFSDEASGFAGRTERFRCPAYAPAKNNASDALYPIFFRLGAHVEFHRLTGECTLGPVSRHLVPGRVRHRVPTASALGEAMKNVSRLKSLVDVSPILPSQVQRGDLGLRAGVFHVFGTSIVTQTELKPFDEAVSMYGSPGTSGPSITHQLRSPRSPVFPEALLEDFDVMRRTYLSVADVGGDRYLPLGIFDGPVAVWRSRELEPLPGGKGKRGVRVAFRLGSDPKLDANWDGIISLIGDVVTTATPGNGVTGQELATLIEPLKTASKFSLQVGTKTFALKAELKPNLSFDLNHDANLQLIRAALSDALLHIDTPIRLRITIQPNLNGSDFPFPVGPPQVLELPLMVDPGDRPTLPVRRQTLVFGDPSYDRQLGSETESTLNRPLDGAPLMLALDRKQYDITSTIFFAIGTYDIATQSFASGNRALKIGFRIAPATKPGEKEVPLRNLRVKNVKDSGSPEFKFEFNTGDGETPVFGLPMAGFLEENGDDVNWKDGDYLVVEAKETDSANPSNVKTILPPVRVRFVDEPVIPPNPAVFSMIQPEIEPAGGQRVSLALHATGPLPTSLEYPNLLKDLASGYVRRRGLFTWTHVGLTPTPSPTGLNRPFLVKIDRAGGGQLPSSDNDFK